MSVVGSYNAETKAMEPLKVEIDRIQGVKEEQSSYQPSENERAVLAMILKDFTKGYVNMYTPRTEFSDLSVIQRTMVDQMAFNTYQPNNGEGYWGDQVNGWRSNAVRPIVRNKCISIAAHATARLLFPKIFAYNEQSDAQKEAAQVMMDLMEWAAEQSDYAMTSLYAVLSALVNPMSIVYTEHAEVMRKVKREKQEDGKYRTEEILDDVYSGFKDVVVSPDEFFFENFYEPDIQKQSFLIWRKVISYQQFRELFPESKFPNAAHVKPGVQTIYNDANQLFYWVYDPNMRPYMVEWVRYWNRSLDLKIDVVNGVMMSAPDAPNPRNDKLMPFVKFGYELINNRCVCYKSLAFKLQHDANIINTLYPMVIDGTYLGLFPPLVLAGEENVSSNIIVPGRATALTNPNSTVTPLQLGTNLKAGFDAMTQVETSINQSSESPAVPEDSHDTTAYALSLREQEKNTILGLFVQMISSFVKQYGKLRMGDILQYMTIADAGKISDDTELVYKTFLMQNRKVEGKSKNRKIKFDSSMPEGDLTDQQKEDESFKTLKAQGGSLAETELYRVNPEVFRDLTYMIVVSPDVMNPLSEGVERAYNLEVYDRAVNNQMADQRAVLELLLQSTPTTKKDTDKFLAKQQPGQSMQNGQGNPLDMAKQAMSMGQPPQPVASPNNPQMQPNMIQ